MNTLSRRLFLQNLGAGAGSIALSSVLVPRAVFAGSSATAAPTGDFVFHGRGFDPLMSHVITGQTIEIVSAASTTLALTSAPDAPEKIKQTVAAGGKAVVGFDKPGLYLLYDDATTRFDRDFGQVVARRNASQYPLPAYMAVLVTHRSGRGLKLTDGHVGIPASYGTFRPWVTVVQAGALVTFTNNDTTLHVVMPSPEPELMPKPGAAGEALSDTLWEERMNSFVPLPLERSGGTGVLTLPQPGLHHYYCPIHAAYSATDYTFYPLKSYGGYPYIMDGVIVVLPT